MAISFEVNRSDYTATRVVESDESLSAGQILARVEHFAVTANNVTYATIGDALGYWNFFPADEGWGRVPAFGFAEVQESRCDDVEVGRRIYGYWPMASHLVLLPGRVNEQGFHDVSDHRKPMANVYNSYSYTESDPMHHVGREAQQMLLFPLFYTAFVVDDLFDDQSFYGADAAVLSSASSKTAIATAHLLHARHQMRVVGLTSARNAEFVRSLGCYDEVATYDSVDEIPIRPTIYADFSGSPTVRFTVHNHFADALVHSTLIGGTHWDEVGGTLDVENTPGPAPEFFFAPSQIAKRTQDWGRRELEKRTAESWEKFSKWSDSWLEIVHHSGADEMTDLWTAMLAGDVDPTQGHTADLSLS